MSEQDGRDVGEGEFHLDVRQALAISEDHGPGNGAAFVTFLFSEFGATINFELLNETVESGEAVAKGSGRLSSLAAIEQPSLIQVPIKVDQEAFVHWSYSFLWEVNLGSKPTESSADRGSVTERVMDASPMIDERPHPFPAERIQRFRAMGKRCAVRTQSPRVSKDMEDFSGIRLQRGSRAAPKPGWESETPPIAFRSVESLKTL